MARFGFADDFEVSVLIWNGRRVGNDIVEVNQAAIFI